MNECPIYETGVLAYRRYTQWRLLAYLIDRELTLTLACLTALQSRTQQVIKTCYRIKASRPRHGKLHVGDVAFTGHR